MRYIFPFKYIPIGSRIVIYGATQTGYDFYRQVSSTGYCQIVSWIDGQYEWWREMGLSVDPPESVVGKDFDLVILTAETESTAESMRRSLEELGVPRDKCFWKSDYSIGHDIVKKYDAERVERESGEAVQESPIKYLNSDTLDIVVRVLYARDILANSDTGTHRDMYKRMMVNQHGGVEPLEDMVHAYFTEYDMKRGWKAFDQSFAGLVLAMRDNGFDRGYFIPVDSDGGMINGRHRLAAAIALDIPVWTRKYLFRGFHYHFNSEWLMEQGLFGNEIVEVVEEYHNLVDS